MKVFAENTSSRNAGGGNAGGGLVSRAGRAVRNGVNRVRNAIGGAVNRLTGRG